MKKYFALSVISLLILLPVMIIAGTTGKLTGIVFDEETGNPLPFANVILEGSGLGAVTDMDGRFFILNVKAGTYELIARYVGYNDYRKTEVRILIDETTEVDFDMTQTTIEMEEIVKVEGSKFVDVKQSVEKKLITREKISRLPVTRFEEVLEVNPGFVRGGAGDELHVRGGRGGEILYMVDGVPIKDPLIGGGFGMRLGTNAIEEMEILTGGFSAEYGDAQSAVVNLVTQEGSVNKTTRRIYYKTDDLGSSFRNSSWNSDRVEFSMGGPDNFIPNFLNSAFGLNVKGDLTYFISTDGEWTDTYVTYPSRIYTKQKYDLQVFGDPLASFNFADRRENFYSWNVKSVYKFTPTKKLTLGYRGSSEAKHLYRDGANVGQIYRFLPENAPWEYENSDQESFNFNHVLGSGKTFYNVNLSRFNTFSYRTPANKTPDFFKDGAGIVFRGSQDLDGDGFYDRGYDQWIQWRETNSTIWTGKLDMTSQIHPSHEGKAGFELKYNVNKKKEIQYAYFTYDGPPDEGEYPDQGIFRDFFTRTPTIAALYVQDKIESKGMVVRLGLRYDLFNPQIDTFVDPTTFTVQDVNIKHNVSPRLGISHPISEKANLYFNFGWFYQIPEFQYIFYQATQGSNAYTYYGNPNLGFEKTVQYALGIQQGIGDHWKFEAKGFFKDIRGLIDMERRGEPPIVGNIYENLDYGNARGLEANLEKRYSNYTSGSINYTLQWAQGKSSSDRQNYDLNFAGKPLPVREHPLDWDQRHAIITDFDFRVPAGDHPNLFGLGLPDRWGITILTSYHSGLPYTPEAQQNEIVLPNSERIPYFITWDMKADKSFHVGPFDYSFFLEIENLFNKRNVRRVHDSSGLPDTPDPNSEGFEQRKLDSGFYANPWNWFAGRHLSLGLSMEW
jgi:outer membrane receptor protein involved in Fe transport